MRVSKTGLFVLIFMIVFSIFAANVINIFSNQQAYEESSFAQSKDTNRYLALDDKFEHLIWFLQISDIHISIFRDPTRITQFREFCDITVDVVKPKLVLASGDLTDAKSEDNIGSKQNLGEWEYYRNVLRECRITNKTIWLDIRGNHDNFNVAGQDSKENFFPNYSIQGGHNPRSYMHQVRLNANEGGDLYTFIGIDACLEPGPRRPFNFVGMVDKPEIDEVRRLIARTIASGSDHTIWFGHFPTSCILTTGDDALEGGVRGLIRELNQSMAYVCGHLHTLGGIIPRMYTMQRDGFLELELGDWKDNRRFRLMAIDHGFLSFTDVKHDEWPIVLITNPKHALFIIPTREDLDLIKTSSHIRILAFSIGSISRVRARINSEDWQQCTNVKRSLFVCPWSPSNYLTGIHQIEVSVQDHFGRTKNINQPFSLDGTRLSFDVLPRLVLMTNASLIFKIMFACLLVFSILPMCILRLMHKLVKDEKVSKPVIRPGCLKALLRKMWIMSTVDRIFWPLVLYPVYLAFGPWSIGHIIEDHIGAIFAWGIFVNGTFLPGSLTYAYGFLQIFTFHIPLTIILAHGADSRFQVNVIKAGKTRSVLGYIWLNLPFSILMSIHLYMAYFFLLSYGTMAFLLGPLKTWSVVLATVLWFLALTLPEKCTRNAANVWYVKPVPEMSQTNLSLNNAIVN